ncbi:Peptidase dimerisation domain-containing protein [Aliiruegeria lutimaris]|uniref:Peptidase dimerisation domain-containing protein n=1 Tax=Aliiruegeria lutimaris TaxID=571298 RepID=A0A1G9IES5_9RHOB|nr:Peptidase dimerisation domain-containing protein [Aliiruegeria lutimaris]
MRQLTSEIELLARLVGFRSVTDGPNLDLVDWVQGYLAEAGFEVTRIPSACGTKAGLLARFGAGPGGVLLSSHADVVPVVGQQWQSDPFTLLEQGDRLVGRGTTDMKGFLACALALAGRLKSSPPKRPVMVALSWDEEIGCRGISEMIEHVIPVLGRPNLVIVGEPTGMRLCTGHKGKASYRATCRGEPGHSAMAPIYRNALHLAADLIQALRRV